MTAQAVDLDQFREKPDPLWCSSCQQFLPATSEQWISSILRGDVHGRCRACSRLYYQSHKQTLQEKKNARERAIRRLDVFQLRELIEQYRGRGENVPAYVFERLTIEVNKMRKDPGYAVRTLAKAQDQAVR